MSERDMHITLTAWRQAGPDATGAFETYDVPGVSPDMSFLEMLDVVNERLIIDGKEPIAFDHDCREGICGSCGMMINGQAHGPERGTATCQLHMRKFRDGDHITIEPWRAAAFPIVRDLIVDRSPFDRDHRVGRLHQRAAPAARPTATSSRSRSRSPTRRWTRPRASAAARAWPRARTAPRSCSPSAKLQHLNLLPQGQAERWDRTIAMVDTMESYFGSCTNHRECEAACPKSISIDFIALMNRDYVKAQFKQRRLVGQTFP